MPGALRFNRWWFAAAVSVLLLAVLGWQCRPEAWRARLQAVLQEQSGRTVQIGQLRFVWHDAESRVSARPAALLEVLLDRVDMPPQDQRRGLHIEQVSFMLRPAIPAWWHAWRDGSPWPVESVEGRGVTTAPLPGLADDGYGHWELSSVRFDGVIADVTKPRTATLRLYGLWRQSPVGKQSAVGLPVKGEFHEVVMSLPRDAAPALSLARAQLGVGALRFSSNRLVASSTAATFTVNLAPVSLREALPPLGIAVPETADPAAFTRVAFHAECHRDETGIGCKPLTMQVDDTQMVGQAARSWKASAVHDIPAPWRLQLHADRLDLDRYLPPDNPAEPPFEVPWSLADAWPVEAELTVDRLHIAGVHFRDAKLSLRAGERGLETR